MEDKSDENMMNTSILPNIAASDLTRGSKVRMLGAESSGTNASRHNTTLPMTPARRMTDNDTYSCFGAIYPSMNANQLSIQRNHGGNDYFRWICEKYQGRKSRSWFDDDESVLIFPFPSRVSLPFFSVSLLSFPPGHLIPILSVGF